MSAKIIPFPGSRKPEVGSIKLTDREEAVLRAVGMLEAKSFTDHLANIINERREWNPDATEILAPDGSFQIFLGKSAASGKLTAKYFSGKARARNPNAYYAYRSEAERDSGIARFINGQLRNAEYKADREAEKKAAGRGLELGDVLVSMWGYEQTNVDFYEVTKLIGSSMVEITPIAGCVVDQYAMDQGTVKPVPGHYVGDPIRKKARDGYVSLTSYSGASKADYKLVEGVKVYGTYHWSSYH